MARPYDLVFVGNLSIDKKYCVDNSIIAAMGGSAYNSFCISKIFYPNLSTAFFAPVGNETKRAKLNKYNLNQQVGNDVVFEINEINGTCNTTSIAPCINNTQWDCEHLHISLRRDVDENSFLNGSVDYKTLSVDVILASIKKYKPIIESLKNKIDYLFCNMSEYQHIKDIGIKGSFVVTNEEKPVLVQNSTSLSYFATPTLPHSIKSITGAGDSFIAAFISEQIVQKSIADSVAAGIAAGQLCLGSHSNENLEPKQYQMLFELYKNYTLAMPNRIFVVGPSCAGKTTLVNSNPHLFYPYTQFDDLVVLKERVNFDNGEIRPQQQLLFHDHFERLSRATIKHDDSAFKIVDDSLWLDVMRRLKKKLTNFSLLQFSRGSAEKYIDAFEEVVSKKIEDDNLIVFVDAPFNTRYDRNFKRKEDGGHFVEIDTFSTVYKDSCAEIFSNDLIINNKRVRVIFISNEGDVDTMCVELEGKMLVK